MDINRQQYANKSIQNRFYSKSNCKKTINVKLTERMARGAGNEIYGQGKGNKI